MFLTDNVWLSLAQILILILLDRIMRYWSSLIRTLMSPPLKCSTLSLPWKPVAGHGEFKSRKLRAVQSSWPHSWEHPALCPHCTLAICPWRPWSLPCGLSHWLPLKVLLSNLEDIEAKRWTRNPTQLISSWRPLSFEDPNTFPQPACYSIFLLIGLHINLSIVLKK